MTKHELYYSKYCKYSTIILDEMNKQGLHENYDFICIDTRKMVDNVYHIQLLDGNTKTLPPMINRVPILLLKPNYEILSGNQILDYIKPQSKTIDEEKTLLVNEPMNFSLGKDNSVSGVMSDSYSFLDMSPDELSAKGNGGERQLYNYSTLNESGSISTPALEDKKSKINYTLDQLQQKRNDEIHINK
ncbi:hypothetical protein 162322340 [Organic Lake phycodnavirus 1]|nr:hypothetical protein 162322340 [Organic Lake phycodnavirus 1]